MPQASFDLWADIQQILEFHGTQNAVIGATIVAVLAGVVGYFVVLRGQSFAGHTLSQVGFPGAAGASLVGAPPLLGLVVFCSGAALAIAALSDPRARSRQAETASIGAILAFALALGYLFAHLSSGFAGALYAFLFGTLVGINDTQVLVLAVIAVACLSILLIIGRPLLFASIDPDVAAARGVPVRFLAGLFLLLLGLAVAAAASITGTLLVFALLVAPAAAAQQLTPRPLLGLGLTVAIAIVVSWLGIGIAYFTVYPIGFFVTTIALCIYLGARASHSLRGRRPGRSALPA